jgi:ammonia channel protein AmtB
VTGVLLMTPSSGFVIFLVSSVAGADVSALVAEAQDLNFGHRREATLSLWPTLLLGGLAGCFG